MLERNDFVGIVSGFIREKREEKPMSRDDLAAEIGVSTVAVANWENGKHLPQLYTLYQMGLALEAPLLEELEALIHREEIAQAIDDLNLDLEG